ncbi:MAG: transcription termination factor NusA [bacterium]
MFTDQKQFLSAIAQIAEEKGIAQEKILETIEAAIAAAYKKDYGQRGQDIRAKFDLKTGKIKIFQVKQAIDQEDLKDEEGKERELNPEKEIMLAEAKKIKKNIKTGDELQFKLEFHNDYGRIAAQTAKQVIIQRIREAERESIYDEFKDKKGQIISGTIQRLEDNNVFVDIGRTTGILFQSEQVPHYAYRVGHRFKLYVTDVQENPTGSGIILSHSHPEMISKLFEIEVPEIASGAVEIKAIAREPGERSKIAVVAKDANIDPIGSLVGQKGTRVQTVINELGGEMIDIIAWDKDIKKFIGHALSPAKVSEVKLDKEKKQAMVFVPEDQLSLAIGKKGQNVRLAAKLTGFRIDIAAEAKAVKKSKKSKKKNKSNIK